MLKLTSCSSPKPSKPHTCKPRTINSLREDHSTLSFKTTLAHFDLHCMNKNTETFIKIYSLCFTERNSEIYDSMRGSNNIMVIFEWTIPFKEWKKKICVVCDSLHFLHLSLSNHILWNSCETATKKEEKTILNKFDFTTIIIHLIFY